jgi:hypothetical protein
MQLTFRPVRRVRTIGLTLLALALLTGCGSSQAPNKSPAAPPTSAAASPDPTIASPDPASTSPSQTDSAVESAFSGAFNLSPDGYDSAVTFSVSLGIPVETQDVNDPPNMFRLELPFSANFSVTNLTDRNSSANGTAELHLYFRSSRPMCTQVIKQSPMGDTEEFTNPKGSYCGMTVFQAYPAAGGQVAPRGVYQLAATPVLYDGAKTGPDQTAVYLLDDSAAKVAVAELSKGPDLMGILSGVATQPFSSCKSNTAVMGGAYVYFVASSPVDPVTCPDSSSVAP